MAPNVGDAFALLRSPSAGRRRQRQQQQQQEQSRQQGAASREQDADSLSFKGMGEGLGGLAAATGAGSVTPPMSVGSSSASSSLCDSSSATSGSGGRDALFPLRPGRRVALATPAELAVPPIAWPTVGVFALGVLLYCLPPLLTWHAPSLKTLPIQAYAVYLLFTPLHDAVHRPVMAVAGTRKHRWVNELVGWVSGLVFLAPFPGFRHIHLEHHKHTNVVDRDPDMWSSGGPWHASVPTWLLPLFWATQQMYYYAWYLDKITMRPLPEAFCVALFASVAVVGIVWLLVHGLGWHFCCFYLFPYLIAGTGLAYSFDYAPHRPHEVSRYESIYECTSVLGGVFEPEGADLTTALMGQNHHNVHHMYPQIPFYKYNALWRNHAKELRALGTPIANWLGPLKMK